MKRLNLILLILLAICATNILKGAPEARSASDDLFNKHDAPVDMDGDGRTDLVIARSFGADAPVQWYCKMGNGTIETPINWGRTGPAIPGGRDYPVIGDFDGDRKDDIAVWRPGKQGRFYVINSATMTITVTDLGTTGDDPTVVGDYNGDNRDDFAVYRNGYWFYKTDRESSYVMVAFGEQGDRPAPGDYDGDRKYDLVVVRYPDPETAVYYMLLSTGVFTSEVLDLRVNEPLLETVAVPGDYDGDFRTDLAVVNVLNNSERTFYWRYRSSSTGQISEARWGKATGAWDWVVPGDYDGDGRYDFAVWRQVSTNPTDLNSKFYILTTGSGEIIVKEWGNGYMSRDYPVANNWKGPIVIFWGWM